MQIGYSSCGILQFVSRIDSIKIPAVYDVRTGSRPVTCRGLEAFRDTNPVPSDTKETRDVQLRVREGEKTAFWRPFKGSGCSFTAFPARSDATASDRWLLTRR